VDVDVDRCGIDRQIDDGEGIPVGGQLRVVGVDDRVPDRRGGDVPAVDERREVLPTRPVGLGVAHQPGDAVEGALGQGGSVDGDHRLGDVPPVDGHDCLAAVPTAGCGEGLPAVV